MVTIEGLGHTYPNGRTALAELDLEIDTGVFGLLGPNGAGKTTLMRICCTLLEPTTGRVSVDGYDAVRERAAARSRLGYLPQEFGAWRQCRVSEVLDLLAELGGLDDGARRRKRIAEVLDEVGLADKAGEPVGKLSGGMVRRLGLAQALVHEPPVVLLDEPTVGLDPEERIRFRGLVAELGRDRTVVLSTHLVADLGSACREIAVLEQGRLAFRGRPEELVERGRGRVFEVTAGAGEESVPAGFEVISRITEGDSVRLRGVVDGEAPPGARPVGEPSLEEAYLSMIDARGAGTAAGRPS